MSKKMGKRDRNGEKAQKEDTPCGLILRCAGTSAVGQQVERSKPE